MNGKASLVRTGVVEWTLVEGRDVPRWTVSISGSLFVVHDPQVARELQEGAHVEYQWEQVGPQKVIIHARSLEPRRPEPTRLPDGPVTGASLLAAAMLVAPMELAPSDAVDTTARLARRLGGMLESARQVTSHDGSASAEAAA